MIELPNQFNGVIISSNESSTLVCKYCLEEDIKSNLISPCNCSGTQAFVHRTCLDKWRLTDSSEDKFSKCSICNTQYQYVLSESKLDIIVFKVKLILLVSFDIAIVLIVSISFITLLGFISWVAYINQELAYIWNLNILTAGVIIGLIEFFSLIGMFGLLIMAYDTSGIIVTSFCLDCYYHHGRFIYITLMVFGIIIGIIAFIQYIVYTIHLRAKQNQRKIDALRYIVADLSSI